jgi:subtilase family serine protease
LHLLALGLFAALLLPTANVASEPTEDARAYLQSAPSLLAGPGSLPVIDAAAVVTALGAGPDSDALRFDLFQTISDNSEAALARLICLSGTPYADELAARSWLMALMDGTTGLAQGWTGADPIVLARALEFAAVRPVEVLFEDSEGAVSSIYSFVPPRLIAALAAIQRPDGGFGFADEEPDVAATAEAVMALERYPADARARAMATGARAWLAGQALGAVGLPAADLALLLLSAANAQDVTESLLVALESRQWPDGSFDGDVRSTALALRALTQHLPNIAVEVPATVQTQVGQGQALTVSARVRNTSSRSVPASDLRYRLADESGSVVSSGTLSVTAMLGGESRTVLVGLTGPAVTGVYTLQLTANASGTFDEGRYDDNVLSLKIRVTEPADLVVEPVDLTMVPSPPLLHETTRVSVRVRNLGETPAENVHVQLFSGEPASGGTLLGETVLNVVAKGVPRTLDVFYTPSTLDPITLVARIDPANRVVETNETNNSTALTVTPKAPADFQADFSVYTLTPASGSRLAQGTPVKVEAMFNFQLTRFGQPHFFVGVRDAWPFTTVPVALYRVAADGTATVVKGGEIDLLKPYASDLTGAVYAFAFDLPPDAAAGAYRFRFVVDPEGTRPDLQPANNSIGTDFEITNAGVAELLFDSGSVRADAPIVDASNPTMVRGRVRNIGLATAVGIPVQFKAPNRTYAAVIASLAPGESAEVAQAISLTDMGSQWDVGLTIDPASTIPESTRSNNSATAALTATSCAIAFKSVTPVPDPTPGGTTATLRILAQNVGYTAIAGFTAHARIGGAWIGEAIFRPTVAVGDSVTVDLPISLARIMAGDQEAVVDIQPWSTWPPQYGPKIATGIVLKVRRPDLAVASRGIAVERAYGPLGEELLVPTITVDNLGGLAASTSLRVYRGYPSAGDLVGTGTLEVQAGGVAVYEGTAFAPPASPPFVLTVVLDSEDAIPELNEENNVATRPVEKNLGDVVVAFDETHGPGSTVGLAADTNIGSFAGDHADWVADLEAHGYVVTTLNPDTDGFSPAKLRGVDVLVGPTSVNPLTPDERRLLEEFVLRGGGYFLMGEWGSTIYDLRWWEWEKGVASIFGLEPVQALVGQAVPCGGYCQSFMRGAGLVLQHPVTDGVDVVFGAMPGGFSSLPAGATVLVKSGAYPWTPTDTAVMGVLEFGTGRVGFTGDGTMADASIANCGVMAGCGLASPYYMHSNRRFLRQMIDWLANGGAGDFPADLAISPATITLSNPDPVAGESLRVAVTVRNVGGASTTLGPTTVRFFDGARDTGRILAEVQVPDLPVDQAFEAFFDWDTSLAAGLHVITAVVDPDGLIVERLENNNAAAVQVRVRGRFDLRIDPSDLSIAPGSPPVASVKVHNVGYASVAAGLPIRFSVLEGGARRPLGELALPDIPPRSSVTTTLAWPGEFPKGPFSLVAEVDPADVLADPDRATNVASLDVAPPELAVNAPTPGILWGGAKTVRWTASSLLRPKLSASVSVAPAGGAFTGQGRGEGSFRLDTTQFADGAYVLRVRVEDGLQSTVREIPFTVSNSGLAARTFAGAETWSSTSTGSAATIKLPVGSRVLSATMLMDSEGATRVGVGAGVPGNIRTGSLLRFRGRLHFIGVLDEVVQDWASDDDGATWRAPVALSPAGERISSCFAASNSRGLHVAYQLLEGNPRLLLMSSMDGMAWSAPADWGRSPSGDIALTATEEGVTAFSTFGPGNVYVATADALGRSPAPTAHVTISNFASPSMAIQVGGLLRIAFTSTASAVDPQGALAYTEVPVASYADAAAYAPPVKLAGLPSQVTFGLAGDQLDLAYTIGQYQLYQRCTIGDECTFRDRWLPEPASNGWNEPMLRLGIDHGISSYGTASAWYYGGRWYAARSIRNGAQWGDWGPAGVTLPGESNGGMLFEESAICGAGNILATFSYACWPLLTPRVQTLDVGGDGTQEGARRGSRSDAAQAVEVADALNGWLASHADGDDGALDGQVAVPIHVTSVGAGQTVLRNLEVRYVSAAGIAGFAQPSLFSPGASPSVLDVTLLSFLAPDAVSIISSSGTIVRTLELAPAGARYAASFDGRSTSGLLLPSGRYGFGSAGAVQGEVEIDDVLPTASLGELNGPVAGRVEVTGVATDANFEGSDRNFAGYSLEWSVDGSSWQVIAAGSRPVRGVLGEWNTAGLATGGVQLRLTVQDRAGNSSVALRGVNVDPAAPPAPRITAPTVAGYPIDVVGPRVDLAGTGAIGTTVRVYRSGVVVGDAPCDGKWALSAVDLPSGISTFTARTLQNGVESAEAAPITVGRYALQVSVAGPPDVARPGEVAATISVARTSTLGGPLKVAVSAVDMFGAPASLGLDPGEAVVVPTTSAPAAFDVRVASAGVAPGTYRLRATVTEGGLVSAAASSLFNVTAAGLITARLVSDRAVYASTDPIELSASIKSDLGAGDALGLTALIQVTDPAGAIEDLEPLPIGDLAPGQLAARSVILGGQPRSPGAYQASMIVVDAFGAVHASTGCSFEVVASSPASTLSGTLAVVPSEYRRGLPVQATFAITNGGTEENVTASVLLTDLATGEVVARFDGARSFASGETWGSTVELATPTQAGDLLALLVGNGRALAATSLPLSSWTDVTPPEIKISGVSDGEYRSGSVLPVVTIVDESPFTATRLLDGAAFVEGTVVAAEGFHVLTVEARDSWGNSSSAAVSFTVDTTPPVITIAGVVDGGSLPPPVSPTFTATDDNLDGLANATLDGAPFPSGASVAVPGEHALVVMASDRAGNTSVSSVRFTLAVPEGDANLGARPDDGPRVLVGLGCRRDSDSDEDRAQADHSGEDEHHHAPQDGRRELADRDDDGGSQNRCDEVEDDGHGSTSDDKDEGRDCDENGVRFLRATLDAASIPYEITSGAHAFLHRFRAHWHDVRVLYRFDSTEQPSLEELREATWAGGGLVLVLAGRADADPRLGDTAGFHARGVTQLAGEAARVGDGPLGSARSLTLHGRAVRQQLDGAVEAARTSAGDVIVSTHEYGRGRVVTISFDPEENDTPDVADLLVRAVRWAASGEAAAPVAGVPFFATLSVTAPPGFEADLRLTASPPSGLAVLAAPAASTLDPPTWRFRLAVGETTSRALVLGTPTTSVPPVELLLSIGGAAGWRDLAASSLDVLPAPDVEHLRSAGLAAIEVLAVRPPDRERKAAALDALRDVPARPRSAHEAREAIGSTLEALKRLRGIRTADVEAARTAIDALLRALEIRSLTIP